MASFRPDSALETDKLAKSKPDDVEKAAAAPTATAPPPSSTRRAATLWPFELALYFTLLLVGLILACVFGSKGLNEVAAIDRAATTLSNAPSSFGPVRALGITAAVFAPILALVSLLCAGVLAYGARSGKGWAPRVPTVPLAVLVGAALWSALMLAAVTGCLSYSSALQSTTGAATQLYERAAKLVSNADTSAVKAVDTLGGALPFGKGVLNTAYKVLQGKPAARGDTTAGTALAKEVDQLSRALGLSPEASAQLASTKTCPSACLDLSFIPFIADANKCVCDGAALVSIAGRSKAATSAFRTSMVGGVLLTLAHVLMAARGGVWAGALGAP
jgi:hypothetical protein